MMLGFGLALPMVDEKQVLSSFEFITESAIQESRQLCWNLLILCRLRLHTINIISLSEMMYIRYILYVRYSSLTIYVSKDVWYLYNVSFHTCVNDFKTIHKLKAAIYHCVKIIEFKFTDIFFLINDLVNYVFDTDSHPWLSHLPVSFSKRGY
jgi:hypothetical protein